MRSAVMSQVSVLVGGLYFPESLRWHCERLWFSDFYDHAVHAVSLDGTDERVLEVPNQPSGLGWLPDGRLLVVSMTDRRLLRLEAGGLVEHADLSAVTGYWANDLVVDEAGRSYVTSFGFDLDGLIDSEGPVALYAEPGPPRSALAVVEPDGAVGVAAEGLRFGNGIVITPDGSTLVVAESLGQCLTRFERAADGSLSNPTTFAALPGRAPDGICLDAEGCIWVANAIAPECLRVTAEGEIVQRVDTVMASFCCALGGEKGSTLFVATATTSHHAIASVERRGRIVTIEVEVPGAAAS